MMQQQQQQQHQSVQHQPQMRQRYMKTRLQTNAMNARSSSNSRKSDGYSRDMDPMTRSENYKYGSKRPKSVHETNNRVSFVCFFSVTLDLQRTLAPVIRVPNRCRLH